MTDTATKPFQRLSDLNPSQIAAIRAIPPFGTQSPPVMTRHYPTSAFTGAQRFAEEQAKVFRRMAVPVIPSALLPEPGTAIAHDGYGLPLLIARDKAGTVRVFLNACQHKGAKLIEDCDVHRVARFTCPYHSWTYGLDGRLLAAARADAFEALEKADYALAELAAREFAGLVWAGLDRNNPPDFAQLVPELEDDFAALDLPTAHVYGRRTFAVAANWKLVLEPFMESYHVPRLHAGSIGALFGDITRIIDLLGPHQRKVAGKIDYQPEMLESEPGNIHKVVTFAYQVFPNAVLITSPYYTSLMILMPRSARETLVDYYMLVREPASNAKVEALHARSYELVQQVFGGEDFRAAEISQQGLDSGALERMTYGGMENTIPMFYDELDAQLAR
ncbi:Rieske 2Fe-2S domain-containing protein [Leptolyngbya sp. 15MV]|nr:Rieske 2Fe-2S domain-containing protein [Leptolyngbya sp. 15MV]